jgi:Ulp1 family protease
MNKNKPSHSFILNSFFFVKLHTSLNNRDYNYEKLSIFWEKKNINLFLYHSLLIPINLNNLHWALVSVNIHERKMDYFDSLGNENDGLKVMNALAIVFSEFLKRNKHKEEEALFFDDEEFGKLATRSIINKTEPRFESNFSYLEQTETMGKVSNINFSVDSDSESENDLTMISSFWNFRFPKVPHQNNGRDCGIFMLKFMDSLVSNEKITFTQEEMKYYRHQIALDLILTPQTK